MTRPRKHAAQAGHQRQRLVKGGQILRQLALFQPIVSGLIVGLKHRMVINVGAPKAVQAYGPSHHRLHRQGIRMTVRTLPGGRHRDVMPGLQRARGKFNISAKAAPIESGGGVLDGLFLPQALREWFVSVRRELNLLNGGANGRERLDRRSGSLSNGSRVVSPRTMLSISAAAQPTASVAMTSVDGIMAASGHVYNDMAQVTLLSVLSYRGGHVGRAWYQK